MPVIDPGHALLRVPEHELGDEIRNAGGGHQRARRAAQVMDPPRLELELGVELLLVPVDLRQRLANLAGKHELANRD